MPSSQTQNNLSNDTTNILQRTNSFQVNAIYLHTAYMASPCNGYYIYTALFLLRSLWSKERVCWKK